MSPDAPAGTARTITEIARAKINLTLRVIGRLPNGYHALESVVAFADVGDRLSLTPDAAPSVTVSGRFSAEIAGENLVVRALQKLRENEPRLRLGSVSLEKVLPVGAGLGGGSADAAALLRAVRRSNPALAPHVDWEAVARELGADVPVCLANAAAFVRGMGERVDLIRGFPRLTAVLAHPGATALPQKTAEVFRRLGAPPASAAMERGPLPPFEGPGSVVEYLKAGRNDLTEAARELMPAAAAVEAELAEATGCLLARMSGAGPASVGLFGSMEEATAAAAVLTGAHPDWWVRAVTLS